MRTVAVFLGGALLWMLAIGALELVLDPNGGQWIVKAFNTPPNSPQWEEIAQQLERSGRIELYVISPFAGLAVGIFVGLLQKRRALIVTASCLIPDFLYSLSDHARLWSHSVLGVLRYGLTRSIPFATAVAAAAICHRRSARSIIRTSTQT
jgi:hypothetical protein